MKRNTSITWNQVAVSRLDLNGMTIAIVGGSHVSLPPSPSRR
jgi:hypothetical protein